MSGGYFFRSNGGRRIEISNKEIERLLSKLEIKSFESSDEKEVAGYAEAMETVFDLCQSIPISENCIRQLYRDLLKYSSKDERHRSSYKTNSNSVVAFDEKANQIGIVFETAAFTF